MTKSRKYTQAARGQLTQSRLKQLLHYNAVTGDFTWMVRRGGTAVIGAKTGTPDKEGYLVIKVDTRHYKAHRLAWLYIHGEWPADYIDHKNNINSDNRIANLRNADSFENARNRRISKSNKTGLKGVSYKTSNKKYVAQISHNGRVRHLGYFDSLELAHAEYCKAAKVFHGEFANTGTNSET